MTYNQKYHRFNSFYNHKFGFHINGGNKAFEAAIAQQAKLVKTLEHSPDNNRRLRAEVADVFLIGRLFVNPQDFGQIGEGATSRRARQKGIEMADRILALEVNQSRHHFNGQPLFHAWESLNEILPEAASDDLHKLYDDYQVAFAEKLRAGGFEPIAQNFGTGNGTADQWLRLYPGTLETYHFLGFHEYDWPTMDRLHQQGLRDGNGGRWLSLRYRRIMEGGIRQKYGEKHVCIITECGMTQGVQGGQDIGPWADQNTVPGNRLQLPISADDYWRTLLWYNSELLKDDYLMGACLFVTGDSGGWATFEHLGPIMERLTTFQKVVTDTPPPPSTGLTAMYALNIDPANPQGNPAANQLKDLPVQSLRFTFKDSSGGSQPDSGQLQFYQQKVAELNDAGFSSLLILTNESLSGSPGSGASDADWDGYINRLASRAGQLAQAFAQWRPAFQIWNEPDLTETSPGYDPRLRQAVFGRMLQACHAAIKAVDPNLRVITAGLASGNPNWLQGVINSLGGTLPADAVAFHPYGQRPEPAWPDAAWGFGYVGNLVNGYRNVTSLPLWITEIGVRSNEVNVPIAVAQRGNQQRFAVGIANNEGQAEYLTRFYRAIVNNYSGAVKRVYWFCYSDGMVPPFGLLDGSGQPKPAYTAYRNLPPIAPPTRTYAAQYSDHNLPDTLLFGRTSAVSVTLRNTGNWTWPATGSNPVRLSYQWFTQDGRAVPPVLWEDIRTALPFDVTAGDSVTLNASVSSPRALGPFELRFDLVEELKTRFSQQGVATLNVPVQVSINVPSTQPTPTWTLSASHNNVTSGDDNLLNAIDRISSTRWSSIAVQEPGMWLQIDLMMPQTVRQLRLDNSDSPNDYPRGYRVQLSTDPQNWTTVAEQPNNTQPLNVTFEPTEARYIRIEQTGSSDRWWWSVHEIEVTAEVQMTARASHNNVSSGREGVNFAIDGNRLTRWSSRAVQRPGMWFEVDLNVNKLVSGLSLESSLSPNDYPRGYVIRLSEDGQSWTEVANKSNNDGSVTVNFTPRVARYVRIEQTGSSNGAWWAIHELTVTAETVTVSATASHHSVNTGAGNVLQAFDGYADSRWSSSAPQRPGMWFEVDLQRIRTVNGLKLDSSRSPQNYPRGYIVTASTDRQQWVEVARNPRNTEMLDVTFPPQAARYLRVELTAQAESWWSVHEVVVGYGE